MSDDDDFDVDAFLKKMKKGRGSGSSSSGHTRRAPTWSTTEAYAKEVDTGSYIAIAQKITTKIMGIKAANPTEAMRICQKRVKDNDDSDTLHEAEDFLKGFILPVSASEYDGVAKRYINPDDPEEGPYGHDTPSSEDIRKKIDEAEQEADALFRDMIENDLPTPPGDFNIS